MTPNSPIKLVSELLDLPLLDVDGKYCGIVDDVELQGGAGKDLELKALQVGPGAYRGRVPSWLMSLVKAFAGERIVREHDNEQTFESLGVVDQLAQHLERVDHSRRGVTNIFAGDAHSAKDLTNVERDANLRALAKPQPPA